MIDQAVHRIRSYFLSSGLNRHQAAKAAGISWYAVNEVLSPSGNPKLQTLEAMDRLVPNDFVAPTPAPHPGLLTGEQSLALRDAATAKQREKAGDC